MPVFEYLSTLLLGNNIYSHFLEGLAIAKEHDHDATLRYVWLHRKASENLVIVKKKSFPALWMIKKDTIQSGFFNID